MERTIRVVRSGLHGVQTEAMGQCQMLLAEFLSVGLATRGACDEIVADEGVDPVDRLIAAWLNFQMSGSTSPAADALFNECLSGKNTDLWFSFFALFNLADRVPPATVARLEELLAMDDDVISYYPACALKRPESIAVLGRVILRGEPRLKLSAAASLCKISFVPDARKRQAAEDIARLLEEGPSDWEFQASVAFTLGQIGAHAESTLPKLGLALRSQSGPPGYKQMLVQAIREIGRQVSDKQLAARELAYALDSEDTGVVLIAAEGLCEMGVRTKKTIRALLRLIEHQDPRIRGAAVFHLGELKELAADAVRPLILLWDKEDDNDTLKSIVTALSSMGRPAIEPLIERLSSGKAKDVDLPLAVFLGMDAIPLEEILEIMLTSADRDLTFSIALFMRLAGPRVDAVMPTLRAMVGSGDPRQQHYAVIALSGARQAALPAAPELADLLAQSDDPVLLQWATSVLKWIGPDAAPEVERARPRASGLGKQYLLELKARFEPHIKQQSSSAIPDLRWYRNTAYLRLFRAVGEILRKEGPTSYGRLSELLAETGIEASASKIRLVLRDIELKVEQQTGKANRLTDRGNKSKGGLTVEGERFLDEVILYLNALE